MRHGGLGVGLLNSPSLRRRVDGPVAYPTRTSEWTFPAGGGLVANGQSVTIRTAGGAGSTATGIVRNVNGASFNVYATTIAAADAIAAILGGAWEVVNPAAAIVTSGTAGAGYAPANAAGLSSLGNALSLFRLPALADESGGFPSFTDLGAGVAQTGGPTGRGFVRFASGTAGLAGPTRANIAANSRLTMLMLCRMTTAAAAANPLGGFYNGTLLAIAVRQGISPNQWQANCRNTTGTGILSPAGQAPMGAVPTSWVLLGAHSFANSVALSVNGTLFAGTATGGSNTDVINRIRLHDFSTQGFDVAELGLWLRDFTAAELLEQARRCGVAA